jgi:peptidoglycan/LPS O-acetylase OafA/YrhL
MLLTLLALLTPGADRWPFVVQMITAVGFLAVVLAVAWLSYRWVERPGQLLGRRVERALDARLGPDLSAPPRAPGRRLPAARRGARALVPRRRSRVSDTDVTQHADLG